MKRTVTVVSLAATLPFAPAQPARAAQSPLDGNLETQSAQAGVRFEHVALGRGAPEDAEPAYAAAGAQARKSTLRPRSPIDGGIPDSKIPDVPATVKAAADEYLKPSGAFLDFTGGLLGGPTGWVVGAVMANKFVDDRSDGWSKAEAIIAFPAVLAGALAAVAVGAAVGAVLGVGKLAQALGEAVEGRF